MTTTNTGFRGGNCTRGSVARHSYNRPMPGREELDALLDEMLDHPERQGELEAQIESAFVHERAVMVLDMSGFSRTTQARGIVAFLLVTRRLRQLVVLSREVMRGSGQVGGDNLFCFPLREGSVEPPDIIKGRRSHVSRRVSVAIRLDRDRLWTLLLSARRPDGKRVNLGLKWEAWGSARSCSPSRLAPSFSLQRSR